MIIEITALVVTAIGTASTMLGEASQRLHNSAGDVLVAELQSFAPATALEQAGAANLALSMSGTMTADLARRVFADRDFTLLSSELVLATIVDDRTQDILTLQDAIRDHFVSVLDGEVDQADAASFGARVAEIIAFASQTMVETVRAARPDSLAAIQQTALLKRIVSILDNSQRQHEAMVRQADITRVSERNNFVDDYRKLCAEAHGFIQLPDLERNRRIPADSLYVLPRISEKMSDPSPLFGESGLADFIASVDRTVILGDPGGGKSTLANHVTTFWARDPNAPVPFHVTLRKFGSEIESRSVLQFIEGTLAASYQITPPSDLVEDLLLTGKAAVIFDGLDELVDTSQRRLVTNAVEMFGHRYPLTRILVTSRRVGYEQANLDPTSYAIRHIGEFADEDVAQYVQKWFASQVEYTDEAASKMTAQFITQSAAVPDLRANPLMLSLMCIIFRGESFIPRNRPAIYEKCAILLFEKWDGHRQIEVPLQASGYVDVAMKHLALTFLNSGVGDAGVLYSELVRIMTDYLHPHAIEDRDQAKRAAEQFIDFCKGRAWVFTEAGTTGDGEGLFAFTHRTFLEYFAAVQLVRTNDTPEALARQLLTKVAKEEWDVVAQLAVQQADKHVDRGTERALVAMLNDGRRRNTTGRSNILKFVTRCLPFAVIPPSLVRQISDMCLSFAITNKDAEPFGEQGVGRPWLHMTEQMPAEHIQTSVSEQIESLERHLSQQSEQDRAAFMLLFGVVRSFNGRIHNSPSWSNQWSAVFTTVAASQTEVLLTQANEKPAMYSALSVAGLISPSAAVEAQRRSGIDFGTAFFDDQLLLGLACKPYAPLALQVAGRTWSTVDPDDAEFIESAAQSFIEAFFSWGQRIWRMGPTGSELHRYFHDGSSIDRVKDIPEAVREAAILAAMGEVEISEYADSPVSRGTTLGRVLHETRQTSGELNTNPFTALSLTPRVADFVEGWLAREESVFHSLGAGEVSSA